MTPGKRAISDQDLHAYVDGWLDPARRQAVEDHLAAHPDDAARVRDYRAHAEALRAALRAADPVAVPERLIHATRAGADARRTPWLPRVAAAVLLLAIGIGGGWTLRGVMVTPAPEALASELPRLAAAAHRVFAVEVRYPVEVRAEEAHLMGWLSKRVGRPLAAPDLQAFGFRLMGGRLLPTASGAAAQLMYEDAQGRRVTAYMQANAGGAETAFRFADEDGLAAFYWLDGPMGYALVGPLQRDELFELAQAVYQQIEM